MKIKRLICSLCFVILLLISVFSIQGYFTNGEKLHHDRIGMLQSETPDALDAIYIGGSDVHFFWKPLIGWNQYGIAVWNYSIDSCSISAVKYMLIEARKTQPDALYLISLSTFKRLQTKTSTVIAHRYLDEIPYSMNKLRAIQGFAEKSGYSLTNKAEMLLPIIRFHTRWDTLSSWAVAGPYSGTKASGYDKAFVSKIMNDFPERFQVYDNASAVLPDDARLTVEDFLDYCDQNHVNVLFIKSPQAAKEENQGRMNELEKLVTDRGYPCLDLLENYNELTLDLQTDYLDIMHLNVHGSIKFCRYLGNYLKEHYGFTDKRGTAGWESWDRAKEEYMKGLAPYILPFETEGKRTDLAEPVFVVHQSSDPGDCTTITWDPIDGADGYAVYRRDGEKWEPAGETDQQSFADEAKKSSSTYTVVPFRTLNGEKYYGHFDVKGISLN